ncbi:hypothetical protein ATCC90586_005358 [Pythium insidiosum]|nr:hypothetical protein ATCC90586_005358 [Pythium insidiosum]
MCWHAQQGIFLNFQNLSSSRNEMERAIEMEIQRLESNHTELLLHKETLETQLQAKRMQLQQIRSAAQDCKEALKRSEDDIKMQGEAA